MKKTIVNLLIVASLFMGGWLIIKVTGACEKKDPAHIEKSDSAKTDTLKTDSIKKATIKNNN